MILSLDEQDILFDCDPLCAATEEYGNFSLYKGILVLPHREHLIFLQSRALADRLREARWNDSVPILVHCVYPPYWEVPFQIPAVLGFLHTDPAAVDLKVLQRDMVKVYFEHGQR